MLIQFTVGNFKSFKDKATLSLEATSDNWRAEDNVAVVGDLRLVKAAAIYGANAGGKSNFLDALMRFRHLIRKSSTDSQAGEPIPVVPFRLNSATEAAPSFFEMVFLQKGARYRYGFEATTEVVHAEWLFRQENSIRETRLFTREGATIETGDAFKEGKGLEMRTRANALFLSVSAQFNGEIAGEILAWMDQLRDVSGLADEAYMPFTTAKLNDPEFGPLIRQLVRQADVGIQNLERQELDPDAMAKLIPQKISEAGRDYLLRTSTAGGFVIKTIHQRFDADNKPAGLVEFQLKTEESTGTKKFLALTGPFLSSLNNGTTLIVDEMESNLHPLLTKALVGLFNSSVNRKNAQLIFATHDAGLLDPRTIRRDQVWFVEKDQFGASRLYCLDEFKGIRKEARFGKEYLLGQFGGVPRLGDLPGVLNHGRE